MSAACHNTAACYIVLTTANATFTAAHFAGLKNPHVHLVLPVSAKRNKKEQKNKTKKKLLRCYRGTAPFATVGTPKGTGKWNITYISPWEEQRK